jgi:AcrR family transcriptional regulator
LNRKWRSVGADRGGDARGPGAAGEDLAGVNHGLVHYYFGSNENLLVHVLERFTGRLQALAEAFDQPRRELGIPLPLEALVSLVMTCNLGIMIERLGGIDTGHRELLDWSDQWISR